MSHTVKELTKILGSLFLAMSLSLQGYAQEESKDQSEEPALGLSTDFGTVLIENLGIGKSYNLREIAGTPLKVKNRSTSVVNLKIEVTVPTDKMITRKRRNLGYRELPSLSWVRVANEEFILPPNETAFTDVIITIPDDPSLYGKKFQASIHSKTVGKNFLQLGVWSHIIFSIVESPEAQAKMEENRKRGLKKSAEFSLLPDKVYISKAPLGKKYDIRKENKRTIKIANIGEHPVNLELQTIWVKDSPISLQSGFEQGHPTWLTPKKKSIHLDVDSVVDPGWTLHLPDDPGLSGKNLMFAVKIQPVNEDMVGFTFYGRFYIEVE